MSAISPSAPAFILLFFLLLFFPEQAIQGASDGLLLWFHTVLPTPGSRHDLHPHASAYRRRPPADKTASSAVLQVLRFKRYWCFYSFVRNDLRIPAGTGPLCPGTGEKPDNQKRSCISARFLQLSKPLFLAGYIPGQFPGPLPVGLLLLGIYLPALLLSWIAGHRFSPTALSNSAVPGKQRTAAKKQKPGQRSL